MQRFFRSSMLFPLLGAVSFFLLAGSAHAAATLSASSNEGGPGTGQQGVPVDARMDRAFLGSNGSDASITLSGATVTVGTVRLQTNTGNAQGGAPTGQNLCTSVSIDYGRDIVCNHASLQPGLWYTFTLSGGLLGIMSQLPSKQTLSASSTYVFMTGSFQGGGNFLPPPTVNGGIPRPGSVVPINAKLRIYFNVGGTGGTTMQTSGSYSVLSPTNVVLTTVVSGEPQNTNLLACTTPGSACNMVWDQSGSQLIVTPGKNASTYTGSVGTALVAGQKYLLLIKDGGPGGSIGPQNTAGGRIMGMNGPPFFAMFTATGADTVGPSVRAMFPSSGATLVDRATYDISIGFSEAIDPLTITGGSVLLFQDNGDGDFSPATDTLISTTYVSYSSKDNTAHISPSNLLAASAKHFVVVKTGVKDIAGNTLLRQAVASFTTSAKINGGDSDATAPAIKSLNGDNFSIALTFSEPMKFDASVNRAKTSSTNGSAVNNALSWKLTMKPEGFTYDLSANGRTIQYDPPSRTLIFGGLMLPPNQGFVIQAKTSSGVTRAQDLSANLLSPTSGTGSVRSMDQTQGMLTPGGDSGDFNFFTNGLRPKMMLPMSPVAGATTNYEAMIATAQVIPSGGKIIFTFPTGFSTAGTCTTKPTIPMNNDINGPGAGTITIAGIACNNVERTVTVTTGGGATQTSDMLHFLIQGIINTPVSTSRDTSDGYRIDIKTQSSTGTLLESMTSMPIMINQGGSRQISGTVFKDNGTGGGTSGDQVKNGGELGVRNIQVCIGGPSSNSCATTDTNGAYSFTGLNDGFYHVKLPPIGSGALFVGGSPNRDVNISGTNQTVDFGLTATTQTITVSITGIPSNTALDVFAFNPNSNMAGNVVRELDYTGATRSVNLPVATGTWNVGVGPRMNKDPSMGAGSMAADFTFMPPPPKNVIVPSGGSANVSFALTAADFQIKGKVVTASGSVIGNAFIMARPTTTSGDGMKESGAQAKPDGLFSLFVSSGSYVVQAMMPGMPPSTSMPVLVKPDSGNVATDGNSTADIYMNGSLVTIASPLRLTILQGGLSIAGQVLDESGNSVPYAHVMGKKKTDGSFNGIFRDAPTNSTGNYTLYVEAGTWDVTAFVPGFGELPAATVVVTTNNVTGQNLQVSSSNFGTASGKVLQNGSGVGGAFVNVYGANGGNHTVSAADGSYSMKVRAGMYTVDGFLPGTGPTSSDSVTITAGQTTAKNLSIAAGATIMVTIPGITNAFVNANDSNGRGNGMNSATSTGVYTLTVAAGTYTVRAQSPTLGLIGSQSVTVLGGATQSITFTAATTYAVTGTISSSSTTCTLGASVAFSDSTNGRVTVATARDDGTYSVDLPNGTYRITAGNAGCVDSEAPSTITVSGAALSTGTNRTLNPSTSTITGRVTLDGVSVALSTKVFAKTSDGKFAFVDVSSGSYTIKVMPGTWTLVARSDGYASAETAVSASAGSNTQNLTVTAIAGYTRQDPLSTAVTPTAGGMVKNSTIGEKFALNLPAGALGSSSNAGSVTTAPTTAFVSQTATAQTVGSSAVEVTPKDENGTTKSKLDVPGTITLSVSDADLTAAGVTDITLLSLASWDDNAGWVPLTTTVDSTSKTLTASVEHFSVIIPIVPRGGGSSSPGASPGSTPGNTSTGTPGGGRRGAVGGGGAAALTPSAHAAATVVAPSALQSVRNLLKMEVGGRSVVFKDIPVQSWFASAVATVLQSGIASGYRDAKGNLTGEFGPARQITYAEAAKMALEAARIGQATGAFTVQNRTARASWAKGYVRALEDMQVSVFTDRLNINESATRGAVMQTIVEVLGITDQPAAVPPVVTGSGSTSGSGSVLSGSGATLTGSGTSVMVPPAPVEEKVPVITFSDLSPDHKYAAAITLLVEKGIITGDTKKDGTAKGTVRPNAPINRAEVAKIFTKLIEEGLVK